MIGVSALLLSSLLAVADVTTPVGVARIDITPEHPVRLNGFGFRRAESEGVRQPIHAKALAIGGDRPGQGPAVVITVDTLCIPDRLTKQVAEQLAAEGVSVDRLAIMATHTHTAPMINNVSPTLFGTAIPEDHQAHIDQYSKTLAERLVQVARRALRDRRPARLRWGIGSVSFAVNRRTAGGPVDHDLPVLAVYDASDKLRAVWINYACHCVTLSDNRISGDWAGYAQSEIERLHPGCTALVSIGCGADANPDSGVTGDRGDIAQAQGVEIATEVSRLLATPLVQLTSPIVAEYRRIRLPLAKLPSRQHWEELAPRDDAVGFHARTQIGRLDRGEPLLTEIDYPIQTWRFGEQLAMVFLPGEVVVDYALRLKRELDRSRLWVNAYSNHCPGYVPSERILREGGYEATGAMMYYDIPGPYAAGLEQKIVSAVRQQVGSKFARKPDSDDHSRTQGVAPQGPDEALSTFRHDAKLRIELMAAEPLVSSPVAIAFGLNGELWVAEMLDYPSGKDGQYSPGRAADSMVPSPPPAQRNSGGEGRVRGENVLSAARPGGRIKRLTDKNRDGQFDEATVFLDGIPFPTGVTVWRDGLLICAAPDILLARDTDGDGRGRPSYGELAESTDGDVHRTGSSLESTDGDVHRTGSLLECGVDSTGQFRFADIAADDARYFLALMKDNQRWDILDAVLTGRAGCIVDV